MLNKHPCVHIPVVFAVDFVWCVYQPPVEHMHLACPCSSVASLDIADAGQYIAGV